MNKKLSIAAVMTTVAFATLAFMPASADSLGSSDRSAGPEFNVALNTVETPQHLVWDMTYGEQSPPVVTADEPADASEESDNVVDLSVG